MRKSLMLLAFAAVIFAAGSGSAATGAPQAVATPAGATPAGATQAPAVPTDGATPGSATALDPCSLITTDEAAAALGEPVAPGQVPTPGADSCLFSGHPAQGFDINGVEISITSGSDFDPGQKSIAGLTVTPIFGVGDAAYYVSVGAGLVVLNVRKGQITFEVSVLLAGASDTQLQAAEKTLASAIVGRI